MKLTYNFTDHAYENLKKNAFENKRNLGAQLNTILEGIYEKKSPFPMIVYNITGLKHTLLYYKHDDNDMIACTTGENTEITYREKSKIFQNYFTDQELKNKVTKID